MLINLRNAMMAGKRWKNPYVTNGLVRQWDGEWNEAGGVHNSQFQGWTDLATGTVCPFSIVNETPNWGEKYWESVSSSDGKFFSSDVPDLRYTPGSTIEFVAYKNTAARGTVFGGYGLTGGNGFGAEWYLNGVCRLYYNATPDVRSPNGSFPIQTICYFAGVRDGGVFSISDGSNTIQSVESTARTFNASPIRIGTDVRSTMMCLNGKVFAIRIYNRALTADEIAANYAIDKARFHLP